MLPKKKDCRNVRLTKEMDRWDVCFKDWTNVKKGLQKYEV